MITRPLGRTGLIVSRLGLGLAAVGRPGYITLGRAHDLPAERTVAAMSARAATLLDAAQAAGVRYVDAARSYGHAEEFLSTWLRRRAVPHDTITVGSKWGYAYTAGWQVTAAVHEQKELSPARFAAQIEESRALLGPWLDLYQIHSATAESGCLRDATLLAALVEGRRRGWYRAIGVTLTGATAAQALDEAMAARVDGERVFDVVQATYNLLEPSLAAGLRAAHAAGVGVIVKEAHANGRLTDANDRRDDAALVAELRRIAGAAGLPLDRLALAFIASQPWVDCVLSGAATEPQLASHVAGIAHVLPDGVLGDLARHAEAPASYWATRASLAWA